jgi:HAD superfamily hydrolase (TIGR01509 family)
MVLTRFDLSEYFSAVVSAEDVGSRGKPAPDIYLYTAKKVHARPGECVVVEDSTNGVTSGKAAGMRVVAYQTPFNKDYDLTGADAIITNLRELTKNL